MKILIRLSNNKIIFLIVNETDIVKDVKEKIIKMIPHQNHSYTLVFNCNVMEDDKKIMDYDIYDDATIYLETFEKSGCFIDNLKEEAKTPIAKKIGFDMNLIKRDELHINLIHFDLNMTNGENYRYFNNFKVDVIGGFYAMDDVNIFKKFLQKISEKDIPFLVVSSGSSGKEIIPICKEYSFIKEVIIFCMNYEYNKHYLDEYPGYVKKITTYASELYDYLKKFYGKKLCPECHPELPYQFQKFKWIYRYKNVQ